MRETKIVVIGAGSASFGLATLCDAVNTPELRGSTISLVDTDSSALECMAAVAHRMNDESGAGLVIEHTTDRTKALRGAEYVIISIAVDRNRLWKYDWEIPIKHGIKHTLGENGGPGGLFHCMRNIPIILDICRDIERLCPNALVLNFTNPVPRITSAIAQNTGVKAVGLCHGIGGQLHALAHVMGVDAQNLDVKAAGLNHFTWILDLRFKDTGEDAYPMLRSKLASFDPGFQPLCRKMFDIYGYYPSPGDDHIGEYLSFATEYCPMHGYDFAAADKHKADMWARLNRIAGGEDTVSDLIAWKSGERAFDIIVGTIANTNYLELAVNVPNKGYITSLPDGVVVEVPAVVSSLGLSQLVVGDLPEGIAQLCATQAGVQELAVKAAVTGDRRTALCALLADPVIQSVDTAEKILDELLALEADYLPQFS